MGSDARLRQLVTTLHQQIPLNQAMQVGVVSYEPDSLTLMAQLLPNSNYAATAFDGSMNEPLTLAGWGRLWRLLDEVNIGMFGAGYFRSRWEAIEPGRFYAMCDA